MSLPENDPLISSAYTDLARPTVPAEDATAAVHLRMRQRARRRRGAVAVVAACVVAVAATGTFQVVNRPTPGAGGSAGGGGVVTSGAVPDTGSNSCAFAYNPQTLRERDWAADATVTRIGRGSGTVTVQLDVNTWYRGGDGDTLRVQLPSPRSKVEDAPPSYEVGTRLLLSGARAGNARLAWTCGFTRYYDIDTAAVWAKVFTR